MYVVRDLNWRAIGRTIIFSMTTTMRKKFDDNMPITSVSGGLDMSFRVHSRQIVRTYVNRIQIVGVLVLFFGYCFPLLSHALPTNTKPRRPGCSMTWPNGPHQGRGYRPIRPSFWTIRPDWLGPINLQLGCDGLGHWAWGSARPEL